MTETHKSQKTKKDNSYRQYALVFVIVLVTVSGDLWLFYKRNSYGSLGDNSAFVVGKLAPNSISSKEYEAEVIALEKKVVPAEGFELPIVWGDLGRQLIAKGVVDGKKFEEIYAKQGGMNDEQKQLLYGENLEKVRITPENALTLLNLWWALGLSNKSVVLDKGPMVDPRYGGAGNFASTGGWSLSDGDAMSHYSKHSFIVLSASQQAVVERVSKEIYRPCCSNSTYFPDCNHGMAMLGLLELMAKQGVSEGEMYKVALQVNSYWFANTYLTLAKYFEKNGISWDQVSPSVVLGKDYSSSVGYQQVRAKVDSVQTSRGASCGV